jgi:hypothetical protein
MLSEAEMSETADLLRYERRKEQLKREHKHDMNARLAADAYASLLFSALRQLRASFIQLQTHPEIKKQTEAHTKE